MPRKARKVSSTGIYHIMIRGINRQSIFLDKEDNEKFLQIVEECKVLSEFNLYGYCLMGNHVHLLLREGKEKLELIFKRIGSRYVHWYNKKHLRCGHLFQDRYKSEAVESDQYFVVALRYIHQNPIRAGLSKSCGDYKWSSYNNYIGAKGIVDCEFAHNIIGINNFERFMNDACAENCLEECHKLGDSELIEEIKRRHGIEAKMIQNEPKKAIESLLKRILEIDGISTRQVSRVTGIPANIIWKL